MALSTETYLASGSNREFQVASKILSESHVRVHIDYDDGNGDISIPSSQWDLLGSTILFNDAPAADSYVKITVSTDGEGLDDSPTVLSIVAANILEHEKLILLHLSCLIEVLHLNNLT